MKALILDGTLLDDDASRSSLEVLKKTLASHRFEWEVVTLRDKKIAHCRGCFNCWIKTPGVCIINDDARETTKKMIQSDLVVYFSPVTFGGYSHILKAQMDRSISLVLPFFGKFHGETHHKKRYDKYPSILGVGLLASPDEVQEELFRTHVQRNALNLHSPSSACVFSYTGSDQTELMQMINEVLPGVEVFA